MIPSKGHQLSQPSYGWVWSDMPCIMLLAFRLVVHPQQPTLKVDVSEVFASAFLFAAGTPKGLDAKVSFVQPLNPPVFVRAVQNTLVEMSRSEQARK